LIGALQLLAHTAPQAPATNVVHITLAAPAPVPSPWISWTIGAATLCVVAVVAGRRFSKHAEPPRRALRILSAAVAAALALALMESPRDLMDGLPEFAVRLAGRMIFFMVVFGALFGALDLVLNAGTPTRRREWLLAGVASFAVLLPATIRLTNLGEWTPMFANGGTGAAAMAGAAAGLVWWSCLPLRDARLAHVFE
jgi:hypothetical protein